MSRILNARVRRLMMPALLLVALLFAIRLVGQPTVAEAATPHRAAVIVDTGASVYRVVITFTEDSITGIDALQRANADPVVYTFNGQGGAVCRIFGVGRDAGPGCLGGQDGDSRYWAYFKAPAGTSSFKYATVGAGQSKVHDGDVEGWRFGTGAAPEFVTLQSLTGPPQGPGPTNPPVQAPVAPANGVDGSNRSSGPSARGNQAIADAATSVSTLPVTGEAGSPDAATGPAAASENDRATRRENRADEKRTAKKQDTSEAALARSSTDNSSSAASLIWFGVLIAAIVVAIVVARRMRRRPERSS
jgi:hypothetical protein